MWHSVGHTLQMVNIAIQVAKYCRIQTPTTFTSQQLAVVGLLDHPTAAFRTCGAKSSPKIQHTGSESVVSFRFELGRVTRVVGLVYV